MNIITQETRETQVKCVAAPQIRQSSIVKLVRCGSVVADMTYCAKTPVQGVKKLSKTHYVVLQTGEVREYTLTDTKQNESLRKTFNSLRQMINSNFNGSESELFLTLTYKENMQNPEQLYTDFKKFFMRLRYELDGRELAYISIAEPQERGAWHLHILLKAKDGKILFIDNKKMQEIWANGWTETKRIDKNIDNLGAYFVAYFENTEVESEHPGLIVNAKKAKRYKKGGRLHLYPKGFRFFRCSRNIDKPVIEKTTFEKVQAEYGKPIFEQAFELIEDGERQNIIVKQQYNKARKPAH